MSSMAPHMAALLKFSFSKCCNFFPVHEDKDCKYL